jgi:DNA-binding beta-propeller fold protein YncE
MRTIERDTPGRPHPRLRSELGGGRRRWLAVTTLLLLVVPSAAGADMTLVPGFTASVYVSGDGFDTGSARVAGVPSASTLTFDSAGILFFARSGRRYGGGEDYDLTRVYRVTPGGGRLSPAAESRFAYGPPLNNPAVSVARGADLFITTYEHDRKVGAIYRLRDGRAELFAGGTPERGAPPLLVQPEGVAVDATGHVYVADRERGVVMKLDPGGKVVDPSYLTVRRPRSLAMDSTGALWVANDADADAPWQRGQGEIRRVKTKDSVDVIMRGLVAAGIAVTPEGNLFVADRHAGKVMFTSPDGVTGELATFSGGDAPRGIAFAPVTPETRAAGIAGDLFIVTIRRAAWSVNEVVRVSGPFDDTVRAAASSRP